MKQNRRKTRRDPLAPQPSTLPPRLSQRTIVSICVATFLSLLYIYSSALNGHFIFDDLSLPFAFVTRRGSAWEWASSGRPVLMLSYWLNYHFWDVRPFSYHFVNLLIHYVNSGLVFLALTRILTRAGWTTRKSAWAGFAGALVFLVHPLQTESVSYIAGRSESLAAMFLLLSYVVFLYRRKESISWWESLLVLLLFGLAVKTKENAVSLAAVLVLTDLSLPTPFSTRALRLNWRLYALMVPGAIGAAVWVFRGLAHAQSAGFSLPTFTWYQYAFTEARAIFTYIRMAVLPFGQLLDHDFAPSHTIFEHGAIFWITLLAALVTLAILARRRYPLACFGLLMYLLWLAPTSSFIPIDDALVERRMYLPLLGLILIACEFAPRLRLSHTAAVSILALMIVFFGTLCYSRNQLWAEPDRLVQDAADHAIYNPRPLLNYADILVRENRCALAPPYLERASQILHANYYVNIAWGRTLACLGKYGEAIDRLQTAAEFKPSSQAYELMGIVYGKMGQTERAGEALKKAIELDPVSESAHRLLARWYEDSGNLSAAEQEYRAALSLDDKDTWARMRLLQVHAMEAAP